MDPVTVSILMPACNAAPWIGQAIESALAQSCPGKEIIVVENGSADNTADIARSYDSRGVKVFSIPATTASRARNKAFAESHGAFVQYLDADDLLSPGKIAAQIAQLDPARPIVSISARAEFFDGDDPLLAEVQRGWPFIPSTDPKAWLADLLGAGGRGGFVGIHQWLTPRVLIERAGPWDETLAVNNDGEFFSRVVFQAQEIRTALDEVAYYRRFRKNRSLSGAFRRRKGHAESRLRAIELIAGRLLAASSDPRIPAALSRHFYECAYDAHPLHRALSRKAEARALQLNPSAKPPTPTSPKAAVIRSLFGWRIERRLAHWLMLMRNR